jgi:hypothetical protein
MNLHISLLGWFNTASSDKTAESVTPNVTRLRSSPYLLEILWLVAMGELSGRIFKNARRTRETLLFQPVGARGLSIAVSTF